MYSPFSVKRRLGNANLLMDFGFTIENNPNNAIYIENPIKSDQPHFNQKRKVLQEVGLWKYENSVNFPQF